MMLDLFGREVKRGDVIAFSDNNRANMVKYVTARLGVVNNVLPKRKYVKGSARHNKIVKRYAANSNMVIPDEVETQAVVSFYQLYPSDDSFISTQPYVAHNIRKNGKPKRMVSLATQFIIIDKESMSDDWKAIYEGACKAFRI